MLVQIIVLVLAVALGVFVFYPPPPFSERLLSWKRKGKTFIHKGMDVFYIDEKGEGSHGTIICLHGFPSLSYDWIKILPDLKHQFSQIVMVDFVGLGFSDKPRDYQYSIFDQANMVESLAEILKISSAHLLSHDLGDSVALELVARFQSRQGSSKSYLVLKSLCLLNGGLFPGKYYPVLLQRVLLVPVLGNIVSHLSSGLLFRRGFSRVFGTNKPTSDDLDDFYASLRYKDGNLVLPGLLRYISERTANEDRWVGALKTAPIPVLMIYGPADPVNPPPFADHFRRMTPQHQLVELDPSIGHYPQWEDPRTVADAYTVFISSIGAKS